MTIRKILLAAGTAALMSTPAWAHPGPEHGDHGNSANAPGNSAEHGDKGNGEHGKSHKCHAHSVGYVVGGTLVSQALTKDEGAETYSGKLEVKVLHANHHAAGDRNATVTYEVSKARLVFGLQDTNKDGSVGLDDLAPGDTVHVIGKITAVAPKCKGEFTATKTIRRIVFHAAPSAAPTNDKSETEKS
jgi:hypothetical protein